MKKQSYILIGLFNLLIFNSYGSGQSPQQCQYSTIHHIPQKPCQAWMTVFIHGAVKGQFAFWNFLKVWLDRIENTAYEKVVSILREDEFFWQNHAMQGIGLQKISFMKLNNSASAIAHMYHTVAQQYQKDPCLHYYYTFGWSGLLSIKMRYQESRLLYRSLLQEMIKIKQETGIMPRIRIICFSHGGNVALNLAKVKKDEPQDMCLSIDELIFMGVPIQRETDFLLADNMFKKAYHFYSVADGIQTKDCFSFKRFFSNRKFHHRSEFPLPKKLTQVSVKVHSYALRNKYQDTEQLTVPLPENYSRNKVKTIKTAPGHIEFWYLGWTPAWYRNNFPLHPLPVCVVIPAIIDAINNDNTLKNNLEVSLHPQRETMQLRNRRKVYKQSVPFLNTQVFDALRKDAELVKPDNRFYMEHRLRLKTALLVAKGDIIRQENEKQEKKKARKIKKAARRAKTRTTKTRRRSQSDARELSQNKSL